jgi:hypothetical protein
MRLENLHGKAFFNVLLEVSRVVLAFVGREWSLIEILEKFSVLANEVLRGMASYFIEIVRVGSRMRV